MGYKRIGETMSFADIALSKSMENNRAIKMLERINKSIKWRNIEALLLEYYDVGKSKEGADAYPPLMLLNVCYFKNGFVSSRILSLKHK